ncbi:hypothetical protein FOL47_005538 [Perkinsus chesapeaki]|uniref:START domain-containing protein n=1 Tax=Perkinsus chesapeaki TaxID=330153 RepID=A0A7J6LX04_PERCH|nr:hypothetical protein FOL47_005538 [Perkinsus chesapeaki]
MGCTSSKQDKLTAEPNHQSAASGQKHTARSTAPTEAGTARKEQKPKEITTAHHSTAVGHPPSPATTVPTLPTQSSRVYSEPLSQTARDVAKDSQKVLLGFQEDSSFHKTGVVDGVTISVRPSSNGCVPVIAGKTALPVGLGYSVDQVVEYLMDVNARPKWDSSFKGWKVIEEFNEANPPVSICWAAARNLGSVLEGRDFVFAVMAEKLSSSRAVISCRSLDLVDYPEGKYDLSLVRGTIVNSGYIVESLDGVVFVSLFEQVDLGGSIPSFIAERALAALPSKLAKLQDALAAYKPSKPAVEKPVKVEEAPNAEPASKQESVVEQSTAPVLSDEGKRMMKIGLDAQKALLAFETDKSFKSKGKSGPVELSIRPQNGSEMQVVCGKMNWGHEYTISQVMEFLGDLTYKVNWDDQLIEGKVLENYLKDDKKEVTLSWTSYKGEMGVAGRDFIYAAVNEKVSEDKAVMPCRSIDLPKYPEHKFSNDACRGFIQNAGYIIEKAHNGDLMVSFYNQVDVRGSVPTWIVNKATMKQPMTLVSAFAAIKNYKFKPTPVPAVSPATKATVTAKPAEAPKAEVKKAAEEVEAKSAETTAAPTEPVLSDEGKRMMKIGLDAQKALLAFETDKSFKSKGKSGPVELSIRPQNGSEMQVVCGKMNWGHEYTISQVMEFLGDLTYKVNWDDQLIEGKVLENYLKDDKKEVTLSWTSYKGEMGVAGRDFIYAAVNEKISEDKAVMPCRSIDLPKYPEHKFSNDACRGFIQNAGYIIEKVHNGDLMVSFYNQVDVRGSVPTWIVNKATMKQPMTLVSAFAAIKNYKFKPTPVPAVPPATKATATAKPAEAPKAEVKKDTPADKSASAPQAPFAATPAPGKVESAQELESPQEKAAMDAGLAAQKALLAFEKDPAFKSKGRSGNVELFVRPQTSTERQVVCGKMSFGKDYTIQQIMQFINDLSVKETWDSQFQSGRDLETYFKTPSRSLVLTWAAYEKQMGVAGRDFVYAVLTEMPSPTLGVIATRSVDRNDYPEHKFLVNHCRGFIDNAGYVIRDVDGEKMVSFYNQVDVGGSVPTWIVNAAQMKQPASLEATFKAMKKYKFWPPTSSDPVED